MQAIVSKNKTFVMRKSDVGEDIDEHFVEKQYE
jgi:hypothetical protein